jgi:ring-1,2-phenylacetyl-CoA epoxidase subunit PaaC
MTGRVEQESPLSPLTPPCAAALLALADDELVIGHRHSEWLGLSPFLEEDLTLSSIAQDEFGHARALYGLIWPDWTDRDAGVTRRPASQWRSCALTELSGNPWELSLVRHFLYDLAEPLRWTGLAEEFGDQVSGLTQLCTTVIAEERFHARHATDLVMRLAQDEGGHHRLDAQFAALAPLVSGLSPGMTEAGWSAYQQAVNQVLCEGGLTELSLEPGLPNAEDRTVRSDAFASIHAQLVEVASFDPTATW